MQTEFVFKLKLKQMMQNFEPKLNQTSYCEAGINYAWMEPKKPWTANTIILNFMSYLDSSKHRGMHFGLRSVEACRVLIDLFYDNHSTIQQLRLQINPINIDIRMTYELKLLFNPYNLSTHNAHWNLMP